MAYISSQKFLEEVSYGPWPFKRIYDAIIVHDTYFVQWRNAAERLELSSLYKMTTAIRMFTYGIMTNFMDKYLRIGEKTTMDSFIHFVKAVVRFFLPSTWGPNPKDVVRLLIVCESRAFPRMLGRIDCIHWKWKNCPNAWRCMYSGYIREPTIILEDMASNNLWICYAYFGLLGSHNDINVLEQVDVFVNLSEGRSPLINYSVNDHDYTMRYYLIDGIYHSWATFVKTIHTP